MKVLPDYFQAEAQKSLQSGQERGEHGCQQLNRSMSKGMGGRVRNIKKKMQKEGVWQKFSGPWRFPCDAKAARVVELQGGLWAPFFFSPHSKNFQLFPTVMGGAVS